MNWFDARRLAEKMGVSRLYSSDIADAITELPLREQRRIKDRIEDAEQQRRDAWNLP